MTKGIRLNIKGDVSSPDIINDQWTSEAVSPKFLLQGPGSFTTDASGNGQDTVIHGLTYSPAYLFYVNPCYSGVATPASKWGIIDNVYVGVDSSPELITIYTAGAQPNTTYHYYYFIFVEPAAT